MQETAALEILVKKSASSAWSWLITLAAIGLPRGPASSPELSQ